jgi:sigma-54 dependent transcriptional regulator, acetoin dehydrogenase operon transcriptional activator AcoR
MITLAKLDGGPRPHTELVLRIAGGAARDDAESTSAVGASWRRCLNDFKLDPGRDYRTVVHDLGRLKDLEYEHAELVQIARAEMDALYDHISGSGYALLLADTSGVILCEKVDPTLRKMFRHAGLIVGAEWVEEREGTNGIGTCAREARPITIHQSDHFRTRHTNLSCSAAPIHDQEGRVVAVLDASCLSAVGTRETQLHTMALVHSSARLIEKCLFLRRHSGNALLRFHHRPEFVDLLHDGAIAVNSAGVVVAADVTGLKLLGATTRDAVIGRSIAELFDATFEELLSAKHATRRPIWQLRDNTHGRLYYATLVAGSGPEQSAAASPMDHGRTLLRVGCQASAGELTLEDLAGQDPQMRRNLRNALRIAGHGVAVLIRGPTGSGKEVFARALHVASNRCKGAFVAVNCAAIPESLIESELFGYCAGAFTGARRSGLRGRIVQASGGTLFLDEIGDMPVALQTRLLRVLEEHEVTPLGAESALKVDLRVICASHRNLRQLMEAGRFREDLYYRLNGITIELPSLAGRQDRAALIRKCIARECGSASVPADAIESAAFRCLLDYHWPGNIRELRNTIRTALAICDGGVIRCADLPAEIRESGTSGARQVEPMPASFESAERAVLLQVMEQNHWVMSRVAAQLRISRNTLYRKIKAHDIVIARSRRVDTGH